MRLNRSRWSFFYCWLCIVVSSYWGCFRIKTILLFYVKLFIWCSIFFNTRWVSESLRIHNLGKHLFSSRQNKYKKLKVKSSLLTASSVRFSRHVHNSCWIYWIFCQGGIEIWKMILHRVLTQVAYQHYWYSKYSWKKDVCPSVFFFSGASLSLSFVLHATCKMFVHLSFAS